MDDRWRDGGGWMSDGRVDGCTDTQLHGWMNTQTKGQKDGRVDE